MMAAARQRHDRETIITQAEMVWADREQFDRAEWIKTGRIAAPVKLSPRSIPGVAEKIAEIMANGGHCIVDIPPKG